MSEREPRLSEVVAALSHALDLTEGEPPGHAVRTCLIGMRLAEEIGLGPERRSALFYALLLKGARERGAEVARMLGFREETASAIRSLDERWNGRGHPDGLRGEKIPLLGRIACLAQAVEVSVAGRGVDGALALVRERNGRWFDPTLADAFEEVARDRAFWSGLDREDVSSREPSDRTLTAGEQLLDRVAEAFALVIDAKSPYADRHSERVADIAVALAGQMGLNAQTRRLLRRAGLLHDIGMLAIPNPVVDKRGSLTADERYVVEDHPRRSEEILRRVAAFGELAVLAGAHHERIDGSGYPNARRLGDLTLPMRVLAVADVFEAMTAERPYREAMTADEALDVIGREAGVRLCPVSVAALESWIAETGADGRLRLTA